LHLSASEFFVATVCFLYDLLIGEGTAVLKLVELIKELVFFPSQPSGLSAAQSVA